MKDYLKPLNLQGDKNPSKKDVIAEINNLAAHIHKRVFNKFDVKEGFKNSYQTLMVSPERYKRVVTVDRDYNVKVSKLEDELIGDSLASYTYEHIDINKLSVDELLYIFTELETYNHVLNDIISKVKMKK